MRQATLGLFYVVKYLELIFLIAWTGLIFRSAFYFIDLISEQEVIKGDDRLCIIFTGICLVLILWNLFYNNLLINLRFLAKMRCVTFGLCIFDAFNYLFCYCFLVKPCRDQWPTYWSLIKWLIKGGIMGYTIYLVQEKRNQWEDEYDLGVIDSSDTSQLDMYLIVYLLQHPIFIVSRFPIFLLYSILTCCCDKGADIDDNEEFQDRIISFEFVSYELGRLNNFENHPIGRNEFEYNRRLSFVRAQSIRQRPDAAQPSQSMLQRAQQQLGGTIYATFGSKQTGECSICFLQMKAGERITELACHETHQFHEDCYTNFITHNANQPALKLCPLCRTPIDEAAVEKKIFHKASAADLKTEEAFDLGKTKEDKIDDMENELNAIKVAQSLVQPQNSDRGGLVQPQNSNRNALPPIVLPPGGPSAAARDVQMSNLLDQQQNQNQPVPVNASEVEAVGPNRGGVVHIEELPMPARFGDDDDMPEAPE